MKCQKCAKPAIVHLTEIISPGPDTHKPKQAIEIHLCIDHAVAAGLLTPVAESPQPPKIAQPPHVPAPAKPLQPAPQTAQKVTKVPAKAKPSDMAIVPTNTSIFTAKETITEVLPACPHCGITWSQFKQTGIMGCANDYEFFSTRLLPLLQRAQEGATDHVGKFPARQSNQETHRKITTHHLQRQLKRALEVEDYKQAAQLRDQLRSIETT
jgi:protein arginine kinase activator